jgi:hypothetical protein
VVQAAIVQAVGVDQAEDFLAVISQLVRQLNFLGQVMQDQQGAIEFHFLDFHVRDRGGENGASIGFLADIANEALHDFVTDALVLDFCQINAAAFAKLPDEAHVVGNILTTVKKGNLFLRSGNVEENPGK